MSHVPVKFDLHTGDWKQTRYPGIAIRFLRTDKMTGDATALIRMDAGCGYPQHRHVGEEEVLVLAGAYRDHKGVYKAGDYHRFDAGSVHHPVATEDGPCILFAIAHQGIQLIQERAVPERTTEPRFGILIDRWADHPRVAEWHRWWMRRTEELRAKNPWLVSRKNVKKATQEAMAAFLDEETHRLTMRWPLGLFGTQRHKVAATPHLAECVDRLLWSDEPLEARVDDAMFGEYAFKGAGKSVTLPALLLQTAFPEKTVGLLSLKFAQKAFPMPMPPGATPGEKFALMSRTVLAAWKSARPEKSLNMAHWVLWMEYASHHTVRAAMFRA
jgi:hypothetical protein